MRNRRGAWLRHHVLPTRGGVLFRRAERGDWIRFGELEPVREEAFRRALEHAGYLPHSIDVAVERNRAYLRWGDPS
jgi:hypothetical protein